VVLLNACLVIADSGSEPVSSAAITPSILTLPSTAPALGRAFADDDASGTSRAAGLRIQLSNLDTPVAPDDPVPTHLQASLASAGGTTPLPFRGRLEGVHVSRTPLQPPLFSDVFELSGQATHLGQVKLVIEPS
jgi:hypothetical protein